MERDSPNTEHAAHAHSRIRAHQGARDPQMALAGNMWVAVSQRTILGADFQERLQHLYRISFYY